MVMNPGGQEVRHLDGSRINWKNPPKPTARVKWSQTTTGGRIVQGSFRHICHVNRLNNLAKKKFGTGIRIFQSAYNSTVPASAGTHDFDACIDLYIPGVGWYTGQRFLRANGLGAWYRRPPAFSMAHLHGFTLPPASGGDTHSNDFKAAGFKVGKYVDGGYSTAGRQFTSSQIDDYYHHKDGLAYHRPDSSWFPSDIKATIFNLSAYVRARA